MNSYFEKLKSPHFIRYVAGAIVVLGLVAVFLILRAGQPQTQLVTEQVKDVNNLKFALGGTVTAITADNFTFQTGWVEKTAKGNEFVNHDKIVTLANNVKVSTTNAKGTLDYVGQEPLKYLKVGDRLTVYGVGYPYNDAAITAIRIEIQK